MSCGEDNDEPEYPGSDEPAPEIPTDSKILVAYFSWGGTTQRMAQNIAELTGADLFRIEAATPYPTNYTECTQVARAELDNDARPDIASAIDNFEEYDIFFIGCPVWWHTTPMIINTFTESYNFEGKIVIPFCTYASTYRDETLARIVALTPKASHLRGYGSTGSTSGVRNWLQQIGVIQ
ncbi:MAG: hypothetical protein J6C86_03510 [Bacteroidaceae bacterium]|nr:hypothetical protein [Bacteroidaceae bacterium]